MCRYVIRENDVSTHVVELLWKLKLKEQSEKSKSCAILLSFFFLVRLLK